MLWCPKRQQCGNMHWPVFSDSSRLRFWAPKFEKCTLHKTYALSSLQTMMIFFCSGTKAEQPGYSPAISKIHIDICVNRICMRSCMSSHVLIRHYLAGWWSAVTGMTVKEDDEWLKCLDRFDGMVHGSLTLQSNSQLNCVMSDSSFQEKDVAVLCCALSETSENKDQQCPEPLISPKGSVKLMHRELPPLRFYQVFKDSAWRNWTTSLCSSENNAAALHCCHSGFTYVTLLPLKTINPPMHGHDLC